MRILPITLAILTASLTLVPTAGADDADTRYGAIAWSPSTGATGAASHYTNIFIARSEAESSCGQPDCETLVSGSDDHPMALVAARSGRVFYNWGNDWATLRDSLMADCRAYSGAGCRLVRALPL